MFNMGMGLLAAGYDRRINPWQAAAGGLQSAAQFKFNQEEAKWLSQKRKWETEDRDYDQKTQQRYRDWALKKISEIEGKENLSDWDNAMVGALRLLAETGDMGAYKTQMDIYNAADRQNDPGGRVAQARWMVGEIKNPASNFYIPGAENWDSVQLYDAAKERLGELNAYGASLGTDEQQNLREYYAGLEKIVSTPGLSVRDQMTQISTLGNSLGVQPRFMTQGDITYIASRDSFYPLKYMENVPTAPGSAQPTAQQPAAPPVGQTPQTWHAPLALPDETAPTTQPTSRPVVQEGATQFTEQEYGPRFAAAINQQAENDRAEMARAAQEGLDLPELERTMNAFVNQIQMLRDHNALPWISGGKS
jgi:hypothetical protein